ncbi:MAG: capsule biosynthesis protein [Rickettsiales bacterium]|nr:capsule biosynthesis protein [Rickettsiales bacterium]|tara:strand:+ start:868 stop:1092 length:225 start_codon:yes stop_codon:yes gene_type:complete
MNLLEDSKKHCSDAKENYLQHMAVAQKISFELLKASLMAFVHSIIPAIFQTNASKKIIDLNKYLEEKKRVKHEN